RRRESSEARLLHLNRLYAFLSQANQTIVHARTRDELFVQVCRASVEHGQFVMAWIGIPDTESGLLKPLASWGHEDGYLQHVHVYVARASDDSGPAGAITVRDDRRRVLNYIESDPLPPVPWRHEALLRGYHSCASFPVR